VTLWLTPSLTFVVVPTSPPTRVTRIILIGPNTGFGDPKVNGRDPAMEKHWSKSAVPNLFYARLSPSRKKDNSRTP